MLGWAVVFFLLGLVTLYSEFANIVNVPHDWLRVLSALAFVASAVLLYRGKNRPPRMT